MGEVKFTPAQANLQKAITAAEGVESKLSQECWSELNSGNLSHKCIDRANMVMQNFRIELRTRTDGPVTDADKKYMEALEDLVGAMRERKSEQPIDLSEWWEQKRVDISNTIGGWFWPGGW